MEAGPRDNEETAVDEAERAGTVGRIDDLTDLDAHGAGMALGNHGNGENGDASATRGRRADHVHDGPASGEALDVDDADDTDDVDEDPDAGGDDRDGAVDDAPPEADGTPVEPQDLRPPRKLRLWQLAPIVVLSALGSLMFAFPLAFEPGGGTGAVVSMLGLLICGCAAGWVVVAARRVGLSWPGLPAPDSGKRADWRIVALYAVIVATVVFLAVWRVARLR
nr:hypothetical protein [Streptomyces sp. HNM0575]